MTSTEYEYHIDGQKFWCRAGSNDEDVVRSCREEYVLPNVDGYEPGSFCIDVGSHLGAWSLWACQRYIDSKIIAIEPIPENQALFLKNVALNHLENRITLICGAAWSKKEPTVIIPYGDETTESGRIHKFVGNATWIPQNQHNHVVARTIGFNEIVSKIPKVWCVKWDAEMAEFPVIEEASLSDLQKCRWHIGEVHSNAEPIRTKMREANFIEHPIREGFFCFENPKAFSEI